MGIEQRYRSITPEEFNNLMQQPETSEKFLYGGDLDDENYDPYEFYLEQETNEDFLDIGKDWQAIHFMLTGEFTFSGKSQIPSPICNLVMGGRETSFECTYGYIRYLTPEEVKAVSEALKQLNENDLRIHLNPNAFNSAKIYPARTFWDQTQLETLLDIYAKLKDLFYHSAKKGNYILISSD